MWEKELKIIDNLGKLYPRFNSDYTFFANYKNWQKNNSDKARWVYLLCTLHLEQRLPKLENFINENNNWAWYDYKKYFGIKDIIKYDYKIHFLRKDDIESE